MILNIGNNKYIFKKNVISIISSEAVENKLSNKDIIEAAMNRGDYFGEEKDIRSYVISKKEDSIEVYASIISSETLTKRGKMRGWR